MTGMTVISLLRYGFFYLNLAIVIAIAVLAIAGFISALMTRDDAFTVIDRQKQNWLLLTGGATALSLISLILPVGMEMLWIIAAVIVGIYWQDVRPSIKDVLGNAGGPW